MVPRSSQGVSCDSGWDLGTQNHTKYKVGRSLQEGLWFLSWSYGLHFLQQICFPQCSSLQPCPDWVLRCSNILCEPAEIREWNIKPRSPELVPFHPSIPAFESSTSIINMIISSEENGTQSTPRLGMVRDGLWLWLYRKLLSRCFNCPRYPLVI